MIGILVLILLLVWIFVAVWLGKLLSRTVFSRFTATDKSSVKSGLITFLLIAAVFLLPVLDQVIAYPKWQQLCAHTGDYEYGPNMDAKKAFGRTVESTAERHKMTIFPNIKVTYAEEKIHDSESGELVITRPHYRYVAEAFFYWPSSSGSKTAPLLSTCASYRYRNESGVLKKLQLTEIDN